MSYVCGHYCPEWDYAWIEPGDPEMDACICTEPEDARLNRMDRTTAPRLL